MAFRSFANKGNINFFRKLCIRSKQACDPVPVDIEKGEKERRAPCTLLCAKATLAILLLIKFVHYVDTYLAEGVMPLIEAEYELSIDKVARVETGFAIVFALVNPFFGHLSDQISRWTLMCLGVTYWTLFVASCSVIPQEWGWTIPFIRCAVAAIESFFAGISLTLIDDLFPPEKRRGTLIKFNNFSYIMGALGIVVGAIVPSYLGSNWRFALQLVAVAGLACLVLLICVKKEPPRYYTEDHSDDPQMQILSFQYIWKLTSSFFKNLRILSKTRSFVFLTLASWSVNFINEAMFAVVPDFLNRTRAVTSSSFPCLLPDCYYSDFMFYGLIKYAADIVGIQIGMVIITRWFKMYPSADRLVSGLGLMASGCFICIFFFTVQSSFTLAYGSVFVGGVLLNINQAVATDMILSVVMPNSRGTAIALQSIIAQLAGGVCAPFIIQKISDAIQMWQPETSPMRCLQYALIILAILALIGGCFFLCTNFCIEEDRKVVEQARAPSPPPELNLQDILVYDSEDPGYAAQPSLELAPESPDPAPELPAQPADLDTCRFCCFPFLGLAPKLSNPSPEIPAQPPDPSVGLAPEAPDPAPELPAEPPDPDTCRSCCFPFPRTGS
ncbi:protein spinster homolog 1-like isoform X2 [Xenopus laevis]|uniref:Protein spinster homolog 1-like isoform X2 n=1 Tax=Xenopus laevis TaxID=8355 RepID=A0A8J1L849_XENLA|nr:protein spinster homolog 1-like isoform X2 [Xenopus laevis]XP_041425718.1 protein spinster homolog 1-like isoform X2 [Xenopus laevis]XP_041425883.1 protein spinster homolog 1-like isoform X2 [Xenopus laevis]